MALLLKSKIDVLTRQLVSAHNNAESTTELDRKLADYVGFGSPMVKVHSEYFDGLNGLGRVTIHIYADQSAGADYLTRTIFMQDGKIERCNNAMAGMRVFRDLVKHSIGAGLMNRRQWVRERPFVRHRAVYLSILSPLIAEAVRVIGPEFDSAFCDYTGPRITVRPVSLAPDDICDQRELVRKAMVDAGQCWTTYTGGVASCGARRHTARWRDQIQDKTRRLAFITFRSNLERMTEALRALPDYPRKDVPTGWTLMDCV